MTVLRRSIPPSKAQNGCPKQKKPGGQMAAGRVAKSGSAKARHLNFKSGITAAII